MVSIESETAMQEKYKNLFEKIKVKGKISEIIVSEPESLRGQHMGSLIDLVSVKFEDGTEQLDYFVKKRLPMTNFEPAIAEKFQNISLTEGSFLVEMVEELKKVCRQQFNGSDTLIDGLFPKVYYYDEEMIVMENLMKKGYTNLSKLDRMDFDQAKLILEHLVRLHAVSYVLIKLEGGVNNFVEKYPIYSEPFAKKEIADFFGTMFEPSYSVTLGVLKNSNHPDKEKTLKILEKYSGNLTKAMADTVLAENLFDSICHGDSWTNNIMFGPSKESKCDKVILVDFQLLRAGSPNLDIGYFIGTSVKSEVRKRWKELLKMYFDSLKQIVQSLSQPFEFQFEDFLSDFSRKCKLGFVFGMVTIIGFEAMAGINEPELNGDTFTDIMAKWVKDNPQKVEDISSSIVSLVNDFQLFVEL